LPPLKEPQTAVHGTGEPEDPAEVAEELETVASDVEDEPEEETPASSSSTLVLGQPRHREAARARVI